MPAIDLWPARLVTIEQSLLAADGLDVSGPPEHVVFSPGVDVEIEPLRRDSAPASKRPANDPLAAA